MAEIKFKISRCLGTPFHPSGWTTNVFRKSALDEKSSAKEDKITGYHILWFWWVPYNPRSYSYVSHVRKRFQCFSSFIQFDSTRILSSSSFLKEIESILWASVNVTSSNTRRKSFSTVRETLSLDETPGAMERCLYDSDQCFGSNGLDFKRCGKLASSAKRLAVLTSNKWCWSKGVPAAKLINPGSLHGKQIRIRYQLEYYSVSGRHRGIHQIIQFKQAYSSLEQMEWTSVAILW